MNPRDTNAAAVALLVVAGLAVGAGQADNLQSRNVVLTLWGDFFGDTGSALDLPVPVSAAEEALLGGRLARHVLAACPLDAAHQPAVERVGRRLNAQSLLRTRYQFFALDDASINAFALPGGSIFVTRGLAEFVRGDAELAAVAGHEMAHNELGHCLAGHRYQTVLGRLGVRDAGVLMDTLRRAVALPYSREQEFEADERGVLLAAQAGYDARAAAALFRRLDALEPRPRSGWLTPYLESHPAALERAARIERDSQLRK